MIQKFLPDTRIVFATSWLMVETYFLFLTHNTDTGTEFFLEVGLSSHDRSSEGSTDWREHLDVFSLTRKPLGDNCGHYQEVGVHMAHCDGKKATRGYLAMKGFILTANTG